MRERVFVFEVELSTKERENYVRPRIFALRESEIQTVESQCGSQNCYLVVNGTRVCGSFDWLVKELGERVDVR